MQSIFVQAIIVCAFAIAAWWITARFAPDPLLAKLVQLAIFVGVLLWVIVKLIPRIF